MVPLTSAECFPPGVTPAEFRKLLVIRREFLDTCTSHITGADPLPVEWRSNWTATVKTLGRDRDGSQLAEINVRGPEAGMRWTRKIRLVKQRRLNV